MTAVLERDTLPFFAVARGVNPWSVTAGGANDNSDVNGPSVDRRKYRTAIGVMSIVCTLAGSQTATCTLRLQDSADGSTGWADYGAIESLTISDGSAEYGVIKANRNIDGAKPFVRWVGKIDLSAGSVDTAIAAVGALYGGAQNLPVPTAALV